MNGAMHLECNFDVDADGAWSCRWSWVCALDVTVSDRVNAHEEIGLKLGDDSWSESGRTDDHGVSHGETYSGTLYGRNKLVGGEVNWVFKVIANADAEELGAVSGSFTAVVAADH